MSAFIQALDGVVYDKADEYTYADGLLLTDVISLLALIFIAMAWFLVLVLVWVEYRSVVRPARVYKMYSATHRHGKRAA
jgi:hypothetical protein